MIEKLAIDSDVVSQQIDITEKLNEVIDIVNILALASHEESDELAKAAKKAATTGNRKDLHEYLELRRKLL